LGAGATPGAGGTLSKSGAGTAVLTGLPTLGNNSALQVSAGSVKFNVATGTPNVGTGVTATISGTGSVELAGTVSVLGVATPAANRVNIINTSTATAGLLVSSTTGAQQVGNIDGTGTTQVNASASLTANHIIQGALVIGGTDASHLGLVTIDTSDSNGNPLTAGGGANLTGSLNPSTPFAADAPASSSNLASNDSSTSGSSPSVGAGSSSSGSGSSSTVPEPSTIVMLLIAAAGGLGSIRRRRNRMTR
jgi:hypothetical protein